MDRGGNERAAYIVAGAATEQFNYVLADVLKFLLNLGAVPLDQFKVLTVFVLLLVLNCRNGAPSHATGAHGVFVSHGEQVALFVGELHAGLKGIRVEVVTLATIFMYRIMSSYRSPYSARRAK